MSEPSKNNTSGAVVLYHLERDVTRLGRDQDTARDDLNRLRDEVSGIRVDVAALGAKLSVYVSLASLVGGGVVSLITQLLAR